MGCAGREYAEAKTGLLGLGGPWKKLPRNRVLDKPWQMPEGWNASLAALDRRPRGDDRLACGLLTPRGLGGPCQYANIQFERVLSQPGISLGAVLKWVYVLRNVYVDLNDS